MIKTRLYSGNSVTAGGAELIETWRNDPQAKLWVDISDIPPQETRSLLQSLGCHELAIEDALRERHPPKMEHFEDSCLLLYRGFSSCADFVDIKMVQIAFFVNERMLISLRQGESVGVNKSMEDPRLAEWLASPPRLVSRILNFSARTYLQVVLDAEKQLADLEEAITGNPDDSLMYQLISYKTQLRKLLRTFSYHRKMIAEILAGDTGHIPARDEEYRHEYQDVADKFERLESLVAMFYDICGDLVDGHISLSSHRLNQTMQVLTVITAIFVPLGLMSGIYGMNFQNMPELQSENGYYYLLGFMAVTATTLLVMFKRRKWL